MNTIKNTNNINKNSKLTILLHWSSFLLILLSATTILSRELIDDDYLVKAFTESHRQLGLIIFVLLFVRVIARWNNSSKKNNSSALVNFIIKSGHIAIYITIFALPILGLMMTNAQGKQVKLLNLIQLPLITSTNPDLAEKLQDWHQWTAWLLGALVITHIMAAMFHHFILRDRTLTDMLPILITKDKNSIN